MSRPRALGKVLARQATMFTKDNGAFPMWSTSLYCRSMLLLSYTDIYLKSILDCCTRYHHNYFVHNDVTLRTYYAGVPKYVEVSTTVFFERTLCELQATMMVSAWYVIVQMKIQG